MKLKTLEKTNERPPIFYLDGGSGRVLCAIPALEYYALSHYNFSIITHLKEEFLEKIPSYIIMYILLMNQDYLIILLKMAKYLK